MQGSNTSGQVKALLKAGQRQQALVLLSRALKANPDYTEGWWLLSFATDEHSKQVYALQRVLTLSPNNPKAFERLAALSPQEARRQAPALLKQMPARGAVTSTREGRAWAGAIGAGLLVTAAIASVLTLALRVTPAQAQQAEPAAPAQAAVVSTSTLALTASAPTSTPSTALAAEPTQELTELPEVDVLPATGEEEVTVTLITDSDTSALPAFDQFVQSVTNGKGNEAVGVYVEGQFQYPVVQQPSNDPAWVTSNFGEVTEFRIVRQHTGNDGLIAHNYLAGGSFYSLQPGDVAELVMGDGSVLEFEIYEIQSYQALSPNSALSDFLDLDTGEKLTATDLFYRVYGGQMTLTFQTCINRDNISTWGRTFIIGAEL
ncbi:MAG: hypothetical protein KF698_00095 [Anaerolineales bacterium]|nr:hypothetical protein [Anaerolineales bacterium]